jgi:hypothetical protein
MYICFVKLKAEASKKRPIEAPKKTPVPDKKAKFITPEKVEHSLVSHVTGNFLSSDF